MHIPHTKIYSFILILIYFRKFLHSINNCTFFPIAFIFPLYYPISSHVILYCAVQNFSLSTPQIIYLLIVGTRQPTISSDIENDEYNPDAAVSFHQNRTLLCLCFGILFALAMPIGCGFSRGYSSYRIFFKSTKGIS